MAFTVEDYRDLVQLLRENPEWRAELRRELLGEEILRLPELVAENTAAITRLEARVEELAQAQARTEARVEELAQAQARTEARVEELAQAQARTEFTLNELIRTTDARFDRVWTEFGTLKGAQLETRFTARPHLFDTGLRRLRTILITDLIDFAEALDAGILDVREAEALRNLDLLVAGRRGKGDAATDSYLAVEVSGAIHANDVERALDRARLLTRLGFDTKPVVAGISIGGEASAAAAESGVVVVLRDL